MNISLISAFFSAAGCLLLSLYFTANFRDRLRLSFGLLCFSLFLWNAGFSVSESTGSNLWLRLMYIGLYTIPTAAFFFTLTYLNDREHQFLLWLSGFFSTAFLIYSFTDIFNYSWARNLLALLFHAAVLYGCLFLFFKRYREERSKVEKLKLSYLIIGGSIALTVGLTDLIPRDTSVFPQIGCAAVLAFLVFIALGILRYQLFNINELVAKALIGGVVSFVLAAVFSVFIFRAAKDSVPLILLSLFLFIFTIIVLYAPVKRFSEQQTRRIFFSDRLEFRSRLADLISVLWDETDENNIVALIMGFFSSEKGLSASVGLFRNEKDYYFGNFEKLFNGEGLLRFILKNGTTVSFQNVRHNLDRQLSSHFTERNIEFIIPVKAGSDVIGTLNLAIDPDSAILTTEDHRMLKKLADQAGLAIMNSRKYNELKRKDRLAALGEMAAGIAHEIRTPLSAIKGAAQLIDPSANSFENREFLDMIVEEVNRLNNVITEFLNYAKPFVKKTEEVDVSEAVAQAIWMINMKGVPSDIQFINNIDGDIPLIEGDADMIKQVIVNLINNAVEAMPDGGSITLSSAQNRDSMSIIIRDTGPGIDSEKADRIFDPFFTTKQGGTGLGLSICHKIMELHGGAISVENADESGAIFTVSFPVKK